MTAKLDITAVRAYWPISQFSTHYENCHRGQHFTCQIHLLCDEIERQRDRIGRLAAVAESLRKELALPLPIRDWTNARAALARLDKE